MKKEKLGKKLQLNKSTVVSLDDHQARGVRGGAEATATAIWEFCASYHPICFSKPRYVCTAEYCSNPPTFIADCTMPTAPQACCTTPDYPGSCVTPF